MKEESQSRASITKSMFAAMKLLNEHEGEMRKADLVQAIADSVVMTEWECEVPSTSKYNTPRWRIFLEAKSGMYGDAGFIIKKGGTWYLTEDGVEALSGSAESAYSCALQAWKQRSKEKSSLHEESASESEETDNIYSFDNLISYANTQIMEWIQKKNPYEFQEMVGALLRATGLYTPFIAPKGKDGGVDIVAYNDALGTALPRIKVQIKHYPNGTIAVDVVRSLQGILKAGVDVGMIVTSGSFTSEAQKEARHGEKNIRLIDGAEFIQLWLKYYERMSTEDKLLMPIVPIYIIHE